MDRTRRDKVREILISRDIEYFEEKGDVIKVRGGARAMHFITLTLEDTYYKRSLEASADKERIAAAAIRFIETGRSIFFDSGTTVMQLVPRLPDEKLTISTSDPNIALALVKKEHAVVNVIGGSLNRSNLSLSGQMALHFVESTNIDVAFLSPSGFSLECGFTSGNYNESLLKKAIVEKAHLVVALMTGTKIHKAMPHTFATLQDVDIFITDTDPGEEIRKACAEAGVELIVAEA